MKKETKKAAIAALIVSAGLCFGQAPEPSVVEIERTLVSDTEEQITIAEGEFLTLLNLFITVDGSDPAQPSLSGVSIGVITEEGMRFESVNQTVFYGPATLVLPTTDLSNIEVDSLYVYRIDEIETTSYVPKGVAVIPSDTEGPFVVVLETSTDLENWSPVLPGTFGTGSENRFFRTVITKG